MTEHFTIIILFCTISPLAFFIIIGLLRAIQTKNLDTFYLIDSKASTSDYAQSTVAYMLQITTTFYFVYWGYHYGFSNILYTISWGIGIFLFMRFKSRLNYFKNTFKTLPEIFNIRSLRILSALIIILGLLGTVYVEAYYASEFNAQLISSTIGSINMPFWWLFFCLLIFTTLIYSVWGGLQKVYYTDYIQLGFAYLGFSVLFSYLLFYSIQVNIKDGILLSFIIICIYSFLIYEDFNKKNFGFKFYMLLISLLIIIVRFFFLIPTINWSNISSPSNLPGLTTQIKEYMGVVTLAGFTVVNLLWQFCDASNPNNS